MVDCVVPLDGDGDGHKDASRHGRLREDAKQDNSVKVKEDKNRITERSRANLVKGVEEVGEEEDVRVRPEPEGAAEALQQRPEKVPRIKDGERDQEQVEGDPHRALVQDEARSDVTKDADDGEDGLRHRVRSDISRSGHSNFEVQCGPVMKSTFVKLTL